MKKYLKITILLILIGVSVLWYSNVYAASASLSASKMTINVGETTNIFASVSGTETWNLNVSASGGTLSGNNSDADAAGSETSKQVLSPTFTSNKAGTYEIKLSGNIAGSDLHSKSVSEKVTITVKEKENNTGNSGAANNSGASNNTGATNNNEKPNNTGTTNNGGTTNNTSTTNNNDNKPKEPIFNSTNESMYATQDGVNIRSSYSTSSNSIGKLKKGEEVTRIGVGNNGWSKVNYNGTTAYIYSNLLVNTKPEEKDEEKSTKKALKSLKIEPGTLSPEFDSETTKYSVTVGGDITKLDIDAVVEDEKSKLDISGNENLKLGENIIKLVVTAEDGTARTYTITVKKEQQEQLKLDTLSIKGIELNPSFSSDVYEYTVDVDSDISKLDIEALSNSEDATIEILGNEDLQEGENTVIIMLKSEDEKQNVTYQITVKKAVQTLVNQNNTEESTSNMQYVIVGSVLGGILLIIIIVLVVKRIRDNREDDGIELNFMDDLDDDENSLEYNNQNEQYDEDDYFEDGYIEMERQSKRKEKKLYNVEDEVDFSDVDEDLRRKRRGKHF